MSVFADHSIVVTGASEGIGRALSLELARQGPRLALAARNRLRLEELATECTALGARCLVVPTDVTDREACTRLVARTVEAFGDIDVLVNNAGGTVWSPFEAIADLGVFERMMALNFLSCVYLTAGALPHLRRSRGRIVGIASVAGLTGVPERTPYAASKHAMFGFFDSLRIELAGSGVTVTMVAPDFVLSEAHKRAIGPDGAPLGVSPLKQNAIMTAETCARLIVRAMERRQRLLITSPRGRLGRWLRLFAPGLVDRIAARAIREKR